ncbi:MAG: SPFH domain-containing protein [Candidatus Bathyarchaeia archaeon]
MSGLVEIPERLPRVTERRFRAIIILIIILAGLGVSAVFSIGSVEVGKVAVVIDPILRSVYGVGDGTTSQIFFKPPWAQIVKVSVAVDSVDMWSEAGMTGEYPSVPCLTKDGLGVDVDVTVSWDIAPGKGVALYKRFPALDWRVRRIIPIIREVLRDVVVQYTALQTIEKREEIGTLLSQQLSSAFEADESLGGAVLFIQADLREIALPAKFVGAIEAKLAAEQLAIAAEYNKTRILVMANATAQSYIIEAQGLGQSKIVVANATAESLRVIAEQTGMNQTQLAQLYLNLEALKEMAKGGRTTFLIVAGKEGITWLLPVGQ